MKKRDTGGKGRHGHTSVGVSRHGAPDTGRGRRPKRGGDAGPEGEGLQPIRLNRYIARAGICSRREADRLISEGEVTVNDKVVTELGTKVSPVDEVFVKGLRIAPERFEYILLNKPADVITTVKDEKGRRTVMDLLETVTKETSGLFPVGRLDRHTTGVLLVTNDGMLAYRLTHPSYEIEKIYVVRTRNPIDEDQLKELKAGIELEDGIARVDRIHSIPGADVNEVGLSIHEGRNRQLRRMFEKLGNEIVKLERIRYAGLDTTGVRSGKWRRLKRDEIARLYRSVKL